MRGEKAHFQTSYRPFPRPTLRRPRSSDGSASGAIVLPYHLDSSKGNAQRMLLIWMAVAAVAARQIYVHDGAALEAYVPETD